MKKVLILTGFLLLSGCAINNPQTTPTPISTSDATATEKVELNHEQLISGDFSSIAGEYCNINGEAVVINDKGLREGEIAQNGVIYILGMYQMQIRNGSPNADPVGGISITIYPIGVEIENLETDITKTRISYGHDMP